MFLPFSPVKILRKIILIFRVLVLTGRALATYNRDTIAPAWEFSAMRLRRSSLDLSQTQTQAGPAARPTGALYAAGSLFSPPNFGRLGRRH